jgi:hypothetical protein
MSSAEVADEVQHFLSVSERFIRNGHQRVMQSHVLTEGKESVGMVCSVDGSRDSEGRQLVVCYEASTNSGWTPNERDRVSIDNASFLNFSVAELNRSQFEAN